MGYSRKLPRGIVKGEKQMGGLGMEDVYELQGIEHIKQLVGHVRLGTPIWEIEWESIKYVEDRGWMSSTWEFISRKNIKVRINSMWTPELVRDGDKYIMEEVVKMGATKGECKMINRCRLYVKAITVADISTIDGKWLLEVESVKRLGSFIDWPYQGKPGKKAWICWKMWMKKITNGKRRGKRTRIGIQLGGWVGVKGNKCRGSYINDDKLVIWKKMKSDEEWHEMRKETIWKRTGARGGVNWEEKWYPIEVTKVGKIWSVWGDSRLEKGNVGEEKSQREQTATITMWEDFDGEVMTEVLEKNSLAITWRMGESVGRGPSEVRVV